MPKIQIRKSKLRELLEIAWRNGYKRGLRDGRHSDREASSWLTCKIAG
jgi:hypothetical protein